MESLYTLSIAVQWEVERPESESIKNKIEYTFKNVHNLY